MLLGDAAQVVEILGNSALWWLSLSVLLCVLAAVIVWIRSRFRDDSDPAAASVEMLTLARELRRQGDLSQEEFRSIKGRLLEQEARETNANTEAPREAVSADPPPASEDD